MTFLVALFAALHMAPACGAARLSATFTAIPGSEGAGNIVYALTVKNKSKTECFVTGMPQVKLLDKQGRAQPTHPIAVHPGAQTAVRVTLKPGAKATADARFSPDVPGVGEQHLGQCEPTSYTLLLTPTGGGTLRAPIKPPTPVCEHGQLQLSVFTAAK